MDRETYIQHIEQTENIIRPTMGGSKSDWHAAQEKHKSASCSTCKERIKTLRRYHNAKGIREAIVSLGMHRVVGAQGGIYYE